MAHYEWTAMWFREGKWEAVGTTGSMGHALSEMAEWRADLPGAVLAIASRPVPKWQILESSIREGLRGSHLQEL